MISISWIRILKLFPFAVGDCRVDILLAPDVTGKLTLQILRKAAGSAGLLICNIYELTWLVEDKYITIQRSSSYQAKQKKIAEEEAQVEQVAPLVRKNFQIRHAKADELVRVLESMKTTRGRITTVDRSNSIIVYDTENSIAQMTNALRSWMWKRCRLYYIETVVVEANWHVNWCMSDRIHGYDF
jgi:type II secretory pathway component GspD/PulD (secretin)